MGFDGLKLPFKSRWGIGISHNLNEGMNHNDTTSNSFELNLRLGVTSGFNRSSVGFISNLEKDEVASFKNSRLGINFRYGMCFAIKKWNLSVDFERENKLRLGNKINKNIDNNKDSIYFYSQVTDQEGADYIGLTKYLKIGKPGKQLSVSAGFIRVVEERQDWEVNAVYKRHNIFVVHKGFSIGTGIKFNKISLGLEQDFYIESDSRKLFDIRDLQLKLAYDLPLLRI